MRTLKSGLLSAAALALLSSQLAHAAASAEASATGGVLQAGKRSIRYRAEAGRTAVPGTAGRAGAEIFALSYIALPQAPEARPVAFVFDGGPGSGGANLAMALGPRRFVQDQTGSRPRLAVNPASPLVAADLVFIDPAGTGFSRIAPGGSTADFWGVEQDARANAVYIASWLRDHHRTGSPYFIVGRSYGGIRAVVTADYLYDHSEAGGQLAGLVLMSPAVANVMRPPTEADIVSSIPTYAAVAAAHGLGRYRHASVEAVVDQADRFARGPYSAALAAPELAPATRANIAHSLAALTGLPESLIGAKRLRVSSQDMVNGLLAARGERLGLLDGRISGAKAKFAGFPPPRGDPSSNSWILGYDFEAAFSDYARQLGYSTRDTYVALSMESNRAWDWHTPAGFDDGTLGPLRAMMLAHPKLRVLVTAGYYDLTLPFGIARDRLAAARLPTGRWAFRAFPAGHFITNDEDAAPMESTAIAAFLTGKPRQAASR